MVAGISPSLVKKDATLDILDVLVAVGVEVDGWARPKFLKYPTSISGGAVSAVWCC